MRRDMVLSMILISTAKLYAGQRRAFGKGQTVKRSVTRGAVPLQVLENSNAYMLSTTQLSGLASRLGCIKAAVEHGLVVGRFHFLSTMFFFFEFSSV